MGEDRRRVRRGQLVLRQHDCHEGLSETSTDVESLDDLFAACLGVSSPTLIDRLVLQGQDESGEARVVTFSFHTMTVTSEAPSKGVLSELLRRSGK